jgi:hypothetical protein
MWARPRGLRAAEWRASASCCSPDRNTGTTSVPYSLPTSTQLSFNLYLFIQYVLSRMRVKPQARLGSFHRCYFQNIIRIAAVRQEGTSVTQICRKIIPNRIFRIWLYDLLMKVLLNVHGSLPSETAADRILCRCNVCRPAPCGYGL